MKLKKILIILIILNYLLNFIKVSNAALSADQHQEAISILEQLGITTSSTTDPCGLIENRRYFYCNAKDDSSGEDYVYYFNCIGPATPKIVTSTMSVFNQITLIQLYPNCYLPNIYNEIYKLTSLTSLTISYQNSTIPSNTILPSLLKRLVYLAISVPVPESIFNSSLESLSVSITKNGFSLPSNTPLNNITSLTLQISPFYNQLPLNMRTSFVALKEFILYISNDRDEVEYQDYNFPLIPPLLNLKRLYFQFIYSSSENLQLWEFPQSIGSISKSLEELTIQNNGFILPSNQNYFDLIEFNQGLTFVLSSTGMFEKCKSKCIKFPKNSSIEIINENLNFDYFNFTNIASFSLSSNLLNQALPVSSEIDYENIKLFRIEASSFNNSIIPDEYCRFKPNVFNFYDNPLVRLAPSCYTCVGSNFDGSNKLFNTMDYDNFNSTSPPTDCPSYSFSNYSGIAKTNKETKITIQGKDFGWSTKIISPNTTISNDPTLSIQLSNYAVVLTVPKGEGFNKSLTASFGYNYRFTKVFYYSYEEPVIKEFKWISINKTSSKFILIGTGFSFVNSNTIKFNNNTEYTSDIAIESESDESLGQISFTINNERNSTISLISETNLPISSSPLVSFSVISGGQLSNIFNSNILSINTNNQTLNTAGGTITFELIFGGKNNSIDLDHTSLSINNTQCIINSITSNSITFQYPKVKDSDNPKDLTITIGGIEYSTTVNYRNKEKTNIGIIIGPIIGGLVLISLVLIILFLIKRKKKQLNNNDKPSIPLHERSQVKLYVGGKIENVDKF